MVLDLEGIFIDLVETSQFEQNNNLGKRNRINQRVGCLKSFVYEVSTQPILTLLCFSLSLDSKRASGQVLDFYEMIIIILQIERGLSINYTLAIRKDTQKFFELMSQFFNLHIVSYLSKPIIQRILEFVDPKSKYTSIQNINRLIDHSSSKKPQDHPF